MNGNYCLRNIQNKASAPYPDDFKIEMMGNLEGAMESLQIGQDYPNSITISSSCPAQDIYINSVQIREKSSFLISKNV